MPTEVLLMLILVLLALLVFALELLPIEITAMGMLAAMVLSGLVDKDLIVAGLSNKAVVTIAALFILSHALVQTGILEIGTDYLSRRLGHRKDLAVGLFLLIAGLLSGFLNNTAIVAVFIPLTLSLCRRLEISPSRLLIPVSYISILGGMLTVIGTSTNLLVSSLAEEYGVRPISMFEFTELGLICLGIGLIYMLVLGPTLLPDRASLTSLTRTYELQSYLTEVQVTLRSRLIGSNCVEARIRDRYQLSVLAIVRGERQLVDDVLSESFREGDILIVEGSMDNVVRFRNEQKMALLTETTLGDEDLLQQGTIIAEALVTENSSLVGRTLQEINFRRFFGAFVLAIRRRGATLHDRIHRVTLKPADGLLMLIQEKVLDKIDDCMDLLIISEPDLLLHRRPFWWLPLVLLPSAVLLAALGVLEILHGALFSAFLVLAFGALKTREAYRSVDWSVLFLIAAFVPVGHAMARTGTADFIADGIFAAAGWFTNEIHPQVVLAMIYLITSITTQMVSNNAAAIILTPVALGVAQNLGVDPRPFLIAVCFAASAEFMTPMGYQTNLMVYAPGGYRFLDYTRFGAPLNLLFWILSVLLIPIFWPFT